MGISTRQSKKKTKSMVIRLERFVNLVMYPGELTINGSKEALLLMRRKMNESLMRLKKSTWRVRIRGTGEYVMTWTGITESRQTTSECCGSVGRKVSNLQSSIPTTGVPDRQQIRSSLQKTSLIENSRQRHQTRNG